MTVSHATASDLESELLIAQLIEQDLQSLKDAQQAEQFQLTSVLAASALGSGGLPKFMKKSHSEDDGDVAMEVFLSEARLASDCALAEALQVTQDSVLIAGRQLAQKLAAEEKKLSLDSEFARRLQAANDDGTLDIDTIRDVESLLGRAEVENILAADLNAKGKGTVYQDDHELRSKGKRKMIASDDKTEDEDDQSHSIPNPYPLCGICFEPFQVTYSPITASKTATSSIHIDFGLRLPCPKGHAYCQPCLSNYIQSKIIPNGDCGDILEMAVFPIKCPGCPEGVWDEGIPDDVAQRILSEKDMVLWYTQRLFASIERHYCPNPRCSVLVQVHEDPNEPMAVCPSCQEFMCVPCKVLWHENLSCEEFQALPEDERSPEDQSVLVLAKAKNWRRCPACSRLVELTHGCHHIACFCGTHFCHKCGELWDRTLGKCTREPSCALWDENMLLEERERQRVAQRERQQQLHPLVPQQALGPPPPYHRQAVPDDVPHAANEENDIQWLRNPGILRVVHPFTARMVNNLMCGYCGVHANSLADLLYHLEYVQHHSVFACCRRFFSCEADFQRHCHAPIKSGRHEHRIIKRAME